MLVLGLQGSPRKGGNTSNLLTTFLKEAEKTGAQTRVIEVAQKNITPCRGCGYCEKKGFCIIDDDDMSAEIYPLLRKADIIVAATPIFFYGVTGQLKILIDRCQAMWSRKYIFKLSDPRAKQKCGLILSLGATKGKQLFDGVNLIAKYFLDAVGASFDCTLGYRGIEARGDMKNHFEAEKDIEQTVKSFISPLLKRKKILFACRENACRSQMAAAFAQYLAGDKIDASCGGSEPVENINPDMIKVMHEKGIDMAFRKPQSIETALVEQQPDYIVTMGCGEKCPLVPGAERIDWDLPDPAGKPIEFMRDVCDEIEKRVAALQADL
ncbi:NAD(P)H-dependent oxidoreductase [Desulfobacterales bacterium HSG16]|nr:NAD(P)H-dependent oxidoreductase [Desulfobacterales bacterium HSG16]